MKKRSIILVLVCFSLMFFSPGMTSATLVVNTNSSSLNALKNLNETQKKLANVFERISNGLRINKSADDAAGLGGAESNDSDYRAIQRELNNANDGISVIQTAEGAAEQIGKILARMRELAVQGSDGTLSGDDDSTLSTEFSQLKEDADRILFQEPVFDIQNGSRSIQSASVLKIGNLFSERLQDINDEIQSMDSENSDSDGIELIHHIDLTSKSLTDALSELVKMGSFLTKNSEKIIKNAEKKIQKLKLQEKLLKAKSKPKGKR